MMESTEMSPAKSRVLLLLVLAVGISLLFFRIIWGFAIALVMAAVLAGLARPAHDRLTTLLGGRRGIAATLTVVLLVVLVIIPGLLLLGVLAGDAIRISDQVGPWVTEQLRDPGELMKTIEESPTLKELLPYQDRIVEKGGQIVGKVASFLAQTVVRGAIGAAGFFLTLFVTLYATFYFLVEGPALIDGVFGYTRLSNEDKERMVSTFTSVARATLRGTLVIGIIQGTLAGAAFAVAGIEGAVFWGAVMAILSIIPGIGSALIWVPAVIYLALAGRPGAALGLAAWCALVVGTIDNFLRPALVGRDAKMPDLMILLTTLGGLVIFGAAGMVIGPIVGALFITIWSLWGAAVRPEEETSNA